MADMDKFRDEILDMERKVDSGEYTGAKATLVNQLCITGRWALRAKNVPIPDRPTSASDHAAPSEPAIPAQKQE